MIRKLNVPTAILLVACLSLAPTTLAADNVPRAWFAELIDTVKEWVMGGENLRQAPRSERQAPSDEPTPTLKCGGGEHGPIIEPAGPGCGS